MNILEKRKKQANSKALFISIAIHVLIFFITGNIVVLRFYGSRKATVQFKSTERPKLELRKLDMKVRVQQPLMEQMSRPKMQISTRITVPGKQSFSLPKAEAYGRQLPLPTFKASFTNTMTFVGLMELKSKFREISYGMSNVNVFGVRGKGEKIVFVVDASRSMLHDRLGGATSYQFMKEGFYEILHSINSATLFNVILFDGDKVAKFHPKLVPASEANKMAVMEWFAPINRFGDISSNLVSRIYSNLTVQIKNRIDTLSSSNTTAVTDRSLSHSSASNTLTATGGITNSLSISNALAVSGTASLSASNLVSATIASNLATKIIEVLSGADTSQPGIPDGMVNYEPAREYDCPVAAQDRAGWIKGLQAALELRPETIFLIGADWGPQTTARLGLSYFLKHEQYEEYQKLWLNSYRSEEDKTALAEYLENFAVIRKGALMMLDAENRAREEMEMPPKIVRDWDEILVENGVQIPDPPRSSEYYTVTLTPAETRYTTEDLIESLFVIAMENYGYLGFPRINFLLFAAEKVEDTTENEDSGEEVVDKRLTSEMKYKALAKFCRGRFNLIKGSKSLKNVLEQDFPEITEEAEESQ